MCRSDSERFDLEISLDFAPLLLPSRAAAEGLFLRSSWTRGGIVFAGSDLERLDLVIFLPFEVGETLLDKFGDQKLGGFPCLSSRSCINRCCLFSFNFTSSSIRSSGTASVLSSVIIVLARIYVIGLYCPSDDAVWMGRQEWWLLPVLMSVPFGGSWFMEFTVNLTIGLRRLAPKSGRGNDKKDGGSKGGPGPGDISKSYLSYTLHHVTPYQWAAAFY